MKGTRDECCVYRVQSQQYNIHTRKMLLLFHMQVAHRRENRERERERADADVDAAREGEQRYSMLYTHRHSATTQQELYSNLVKPPFFFQDFLRHLLVLLWSQTEILRRSLKMSNLLFVLLHAFCCCCCCCMIFFYYCWCCYYHYYDYSELP